MPRVSMVWAQDEGGGIGFQGGLPWRIPEDLEFFQRLTRGSTVIMGRKQWESLPGSVRPLPERRNIVLSRNPEYVAEGAECHSGVDEALEAVGDELVWIIGGRDIYEAAMPYTERLVITHVLGVHDSDVMAPAIDHRWTVAARWPIEAERAYVSRGGERYFVIEYTLDTP